jgi:predicted ATPase
MLRARLDGVGGRVRQRPGPSGDAAATEAEGCFRQALDLAREQGANSLELRAATSLAGLWAEQGERRRAHEVLAAVFAWFSEGFDMPDLKDAAALLDQLA